jgi:HAD superfamily hydrolase (TIGR01509 family)
MYVQSITKLSQRIQGVILDVDGTLIDSNDAHASAWQNALTEAGYSIEFRDIRRLVGMGADKLLPMLTGIAESSVQGNAISKRRGQIFGQRYLPHLKPFAKADELLTTMKAHGLALSIGTSASRDDLYALVKLLGAYNFIEEQITKDDAGKSKPDPDVIEAALDKLGLPANQILMLGDTPYDIEGAARAGVSTVALRCGGWNDASLAGAIAIYDDPEDLVTRFSQSPFS